MQGMPSTSQGKIAGPGLAPVRYAIGACALGYVLVAQSERGVCALLLGEDEQALHGELRAAFPAATLRRAQPDLAGLLARAASLASSPGSACDLPLDIGGTAFQQRVWQALRAVPAGSTASYADIAARIGRPAAARAVAGACAANLLAIAIPCHRIVKQDGALSGYRWGVQRKRELLQREARA